MARYSEELLTNLLDGVVDKDGDTVSIHRINGSVPDSWPQLVSLSVGVAEVHRDGSVYYLDGDDVSSHPSVGSLIGGGFTFSITDGTDESPSYKAMVQLNAPAASFSLKDKITELRDDPRACGRQSNKALKRPGVDPMPRGMRDIVSKKNIPMIYIDKKFSGDLEDWDFRDRVVFVANNAKVDRIANCVFGETRPIGLFAYLDVLTHGEISLVEWCDFIGPSYFGGAAKAIGSARVHGRGPNIDVPEITTIRHCRFEGLSADSIKAVGSNKPQGQLIEYCYFGPCPYITGAPKGADPHADCITIVAGKNGVTIRQCYMEMRPDRANGPRADIAVNKIVNAVRVARNRGTDFLVDFVDVSECIFDRARDTASHAMQITGSGQPNMGPTSVRDVWISYRNSNPNAEYIFPRPVRLVEWTNVRDLDTDRLLPKPT